MKKFFLFALTGFVFLLVGCNKSSDENTGPAPTLLTCGDLSSERVLRNDPNKAVDYIVDCVISVTGRISIEPGTVIQFEDETGLAVVGGGSLNASGTSSERIIFTSRTKQKGAWKGIYFENASINNVLDYCRIEYGGGTAFNSNDNRGGIVFYAGSRVRLSNTEIWRSDNHGISMEYGNTQITMERNKVSETKGAPIIAAAGNAKFIDSDNDLTGNDASYVELLGGEFEGEQTLNKLNVPYRFSNKGLPFSFSVSGSLTVQAGTIMEFDGGMDFAVRPNGRLLMIGTPSEPIIVKGRDNAPGSWEGFYIDRTTQTSVFEHVEIAHAGVGTNYRNAAITLWGSPRVTVRQVHFKDLAHCALFDHSGPSNPSLTFENNTFTNVVGGEICFE